MSIFVFHADTKELSSVANSIQQHIPDVDAVELSIKERGLVRQFYCTFTNVDKSRKESVSIFLIENSDDAKNYQDATFWSKTLMTKPFTNIKFGPARFLPEVAKIMKVKLGGQAFLDTTDYFDSLSDEKQHLARKIFEKGTFYSKNMASPFGKIEAMTS